jgi:hypothetical protein
MTKKRILKSHKKENLRVSSRTPGWIPLSYGINIMKHLVQMLYTIIPALLFAPFAKMGLLGLWNEEISFAAVNLRRMVRPIWKYWIVCSADYSHINMKLVRQADLLARTSNVGTIMQWHEISNTVWSTHHNPISEHTDHWNFCTSSR